MMIAYNLRYRVKGLDASKNKIHEHVQVITIVELTHRLISIGELPDDTLITSIPNLNKSASCDLTLSSKKLNLLKKIQLKAKTVDKIHDLSILEK